MKETPSSTDRQMYQLHKKGYEDITKALEKVADVKLNGVETVTLKGKDGYTPKKNIDYFTPEEQKSFVEIILAKTPKPKDGEPGKDAIVDYDKLETFIKKEVSKIPRPKDGEPGKDAIVDVDSIVKKVLAKIPKQKEIVVDYNAVKSFIDDKIKDLNIEERLQLARLTNSAGPRTRLGEMHDVDLSGLQTDQYLKWNGKKWVPATISGGGASTFLDLTDTPSTYTGQGNKFVKVNAGGTALEFDTISGGGDMLASTYDPQNIAGDAFDRANHTGEQAISTVTGLQTALDGKVDENSAITGATKTKITYDAKGLVTAGADATTADIADSTNKRYVTDAQLTVIGNTSGTNTGDQDISGKADKSGALTQFVGNTAHRVFYSDASGDVQELALGADGTFLKSNGATSAPSFATPAGSGDVSKVGTPVNNQVGVWTGDGTLEGDTALTFDTTTNTLATEIVTVTDDAYGAGWNGSTAVPTKNAVYDKIESMGGGVTEAFVIAMATAL